MSLKLLVKESSNYVLAFSKDTSKGEKFANLYNALTIWRVAMTAVTESSYIGPCSQIQELCVAIGSLLYSLVESTDSAFRRVTVEKKDEAGQAKTYNVIHTAVGASGVAETVTEQVTQLTYIEDVKTGEMYVDESQFIVACKCACVALGLPFYTIGKICWHVVQTPIRIAMTAYETIVQIGKDLAQCRFGAAIKTMGHGIVQSVQKLGHGVYEIGKSPVFALGCEAAAIYGIFKPYHGRKFEAKVEKAWQQGASYKEDLRLIPARPGEDDWTAFVTDIKKTPAFYLAHCFQVRGNVNEARITVIKRESLTR